MGEYRNVVRCRSCGEITHYPHKLGLVDAEALNSLGYLLCRKCGSIAGWDDSIENWISESVWFNPFTWGKGHWLKKSA